MENATPMLFSIFNELNKKTNLAFSIILPGSKEIKIGDSYGNSTFQIVINNKKGLRAIKSGDELKISEAYVYGDIDLNGQIDMLKLLEITRFLSKEYPFIILWSRLISFFSTQVFINKRSISQHYEFDNEFYLMFLDKARIYSHGIFIDDDEPLENAITRKLEFAKTNCHLRPGSKILDIGSGWGGLAEYLANQDIHVDALTISNQSKSFISKLIEEKNLLNCRVLMKDFLEYTLPQAEVYDALFSLGTLEHLPNYQAVLNKCANLLKPGGYAYFDASAKMAGKPGSYFIERHIFPGNHELLDIYGFLAAVKNSPFELIFLSNDTHNYYLTLMHWGQNLDKHKEEIIKRWGKELYRKFQLYFWGCCFGMSHNEIQAYRIVLRKRISEAKL